MRTLTKNQASLLLYLECRAVDNGGRVRASQMNADDFEQAEAWAKNGFIEFGRIASNYLDESAGNYWVTLSEEAWKCVHAERRARANRAWDRRQWITTEEKRTTA